MASALWLLEAKAFAEEDRTPAATTIKYWLKPGRWAGGEAQAAGWAGTHAATNHVPVASFPDAPPPPCTAAM